MKGYWKGSLALAATLAFAFVPVTAFADSVTYSPGSPNASSVGSAVNSDNSFWVTLDPNGVFLTHAWSDGFVFGTSGFSGYADAGMVLNFNGGLTLGQLQNVSVVAAAGSPPLAINLWLDTGGDGNFFSVNSSGLLGGLNGDSYAGCGAPSLSLTSSCYMLGGNGAGGTFTLADLQAGAVAGIDGNTLAALWIGTTSGAQDQFAYVESVTVTTTPEPGSVLLFGTGLLGLAVVVFRRMKQPHFMPFA